MDDHPVYAAIAVAWAMLISFSGMNSNPSTCRSGAFSLVELLCVMAIIAILAALILPVLEQSQGRVRRIECENNLRQQGMAFQLFLHEHDDKYPMALPVAAGGSQEFVQNGYVVLGEFYFSYRQFQVLSNELGSPVLLVCPADQRLPATNFASLQNSNLSYFIGVNARYANPNSLLAGDRNLTTNFYTSPSRLRIEPGSRLSWTWEMHRFKGNLMFADGRVEEWNNAALITGTGGQLAGAELFLPSVPFVPGPVVASRPASQNPSGANPGAATPRAGANPSGWGMQPESSPPAQPEQFTRAPNPPITGRYASILAKTNKLTSPTTNAPADTTVAATDTGPGAPPVDERLVRILRRILIGLYLFFLLAIALWFLLASLRRSQRRKVQSPGGF